MVVPKYMDAPTPVYTAGPEGGVNGTNVGGTQELIVHKKTNVIRSDTLFLFFECRLDRTCKKPPQPPQRLRNNYKVDLGGWGIKKARDKQVSDVYVDFGTKLNATMPVFMSLGIYIL